MILEKMTFETDQHPVMCMNLLTGGEDSSNDSASLRTGECLQPDYVLCGGAELGHVVRHCCGTQDHLLQEEG